MKGGLNSAIIPRAGRESKKGNMEQLDEGIWWVDTGVEGPRVGISFGVHGNEQPPIDAGLRLRDELATGALRPAAGALLLLHANPRASAIDQRWSEGGVDLNRCFHRDVLARAPQLHEEERARRIAAVLEERDVRVLIDFHCTVEPGERFAMHHPSAADADHLRATALLEAEVVLADPDLHFGAVSLDEWMTTRGRVGVCYETGWIRDPRTTPESVHGEMLNVLRGYGVLPGEARVYEGKRRIELVRALACAAEGFAWSDGVGENLQEVPAGTVLGRYGDGREERLDSESTLIFPKKRPELVQVGKPLVYLARRMPG